MSLSDVNKAVNEHTRWLGGHRKFGPPGSSRKEQGCEITNVYLACKGYIFNEQKRVDLHPYDTVEDAKIAFGRSMRQQKILDEEGYELDPTSQLWQHSRNCNVSLVFGYSPRKEMVNLADQTKVVITKTTSIATNSVGAIQKALSADTLSKEREGHTIKDCCENPSD